MSERGDGTKLCPCSGQRGAPDRPDNHDGRCWWRRLHAEKPGAKPGGGRRPAGRNRVITDGVNAVQTFSAPPGASDYVAVKAPSDHALRAEIAALSEDLQAARRDLEARERDLGQARDAIQGLEAEVRSLRESLHAVGARPRAAAPASAAPLDVLRAIDTLHLDAIEFAARVARWRKTGRRLTTADAATAEAEALSLPENGGGRG